MNHFEQTLNLLKNSAIYYTITLSMDGTYSYVSPSYDQNFSFVYDSLLGKPFYITLHPDDISICGDVAEKCFQNPEKLFLAALRKHDGKGGYVVTQWELKAMLDENGNPAGIFCIGYNISEHFEAKLALNNAAKAIKKKDEQLDEIGFINSHVIRKPLANIIGLAGVLNGMEMSADLKKAVNMIVESALELDYEVKNISNKATN
jgi:hypothetical protein